MNYCLIVICAAFMIYIIYILNVYFVKQQNQLNEL